MTINEFKEVQQKQNYRHLGLFEQNGDCIIKFNTVKMSPKTRLNQIETRLGSPILNAPAYIIKAKSYHGSDTKSDDYIISKNGKLSEEINLITPPAYIPPSNEVEGYSFSKALDLEVKLKAAEMDRDNYKKEFEFLEEELADCHKKLDELETENLSEDEAPNWQTFISEALTTVTPIIDKHLELKERQIMLQENRMPNLESKRNPIGTPQNQVNQEIISQIDDEIIKEINNEENEELKAQLIECYENANNFEDLIKALNIINPELMQTVSNKINSK